MGLYDVYDNKITRNGFEMENKGENHKIFASICRIKENHDNNWRILSVK